MKPKATMTPTHIIRYRPEADALFQLASCRSSAKSPLQFLCSVSIHLDHRPCGGAPFAPCSMTVLSIRRAATVGAILAVACGGGIGDLPLGCPQGAGVRCPQARRREAHRG